MCKRYLLYSALFFSVLSLAQAEDTSLLTPLPSEESLKPNSEPMQLPSELLQRWNEYDLQFKDSMMSLEQFLDQVEAFGIKFEDLPSFMTLLVDSYKKSESARLEERVAQGEQLKKERFKSTVFKITTAGLTILSTVLGVVIWL